MTYKCTSSPSGIAPGTKQTSNPQLILAQPHHARLAQPHHARISHYAPPAALNESVTILRMTSSETMGIPNSLHLACFAGPASPWSFTKWVTFAVTPLET